jgi:hypothetical protein
LLAGQSTVEEHGGKSGRMSLAQGRINNKFAETFFVVDSRLTSDIFHISSVLSANAFLPVGNLFPLGLIIWITFQPSLLILRIRGGFASPNNIRERDCTAKITRLQQLILLLRKTSTTAGKSALLF